MCFPKISTEFRPGYSSQGLIERTEAVPFRMTKNLQTFISTFGLQGPFANCVTNIAQALLTRASVFENQMSLFFRDDLLSWHISKTQPRPESELQRIEAQLKERVQANVQRVIDHIEYVAPSNVETFQCNKIHELINAATDPKVISQMGPTWLPWL